MEKGQIQGILVALHTGVYLYKIPKRECRITELS